MWKLAYLSVKMMSLVQKQNCQEIACLVYEKCISHSKTLNLSELCES